MKKILFVLIVGAFMVSCKKEYTCECTFYWSNGTVGNTSSTTIKDTKEKALSKCAENEMNQQNGSNYSICNLK